MKLHFLGTTGYHANDSRQTACFMLPEIGVVFDAGTGFYRSRPLIQTDQLHIFLTHTHLDHVLGLTYLFNVIKDKETKVIVHVDPAKVASINDYLFFPDLFPIRPNFEIVPFETPLDKTKIELPDGSTLSCIPLIHPGGSLGFRIDWPDRSFAYITDTTADPDADYLKAIDGVDTLIHECYFPDGYEDYCTLTGHSSLSPVAKVASKAGVKQVYLVHINPDKEVGDKIDVDNVKDIFANMTIATDNLVIDV